MTVKWIKIPALTPEQILERDMATEYNHEGERGLLMLVPFTEGQAYEVLIDDAAECFEPSFEWIREQIGDEDMLVEPVSHHNGQDISIMFGDNTCVRMIYADEEGMLKGLMANVVASSVTAPDGVLFGDIIMQLEIND